MSLDTISLSGTDLIQVVLAFVSAYGAFMIWNLPRYRALAHYLIYQTTLMSLNIIEGHTKSLNITPVVFLLKGPLLYFFIRSMVNEKRLSRLLLYGQIVLPMALALLWGNALAANAMGSILQIVYLVLSFRLLHRYHRAAREFRSDAESLKLTWLVVAYWMITAQAVIGLIRLNLQPFLDHRLLMNWFDFDILFLLGVCCFLLFKAIRQPLLYDEMLEYEGASQRPSPEDRDVDEAGARSVFACLEAVILEDQLYRQPRLSVEDLAKKTGMQMKDISWAFNAGEKTSFNEYINRLRVNALKQRLLASDMSETSLLELAFETGFNSKSSFNATFKREVGMTPTQFIQARGVDGGLMDAGPNIPVPHRL